MTLALAQLDWQLMVELDEADSGIVVSVLIILLAVLVARFLARPLQQLTTTCRGISSDFEPELPNVQGREARELRVALEMIFLRAGALAAVGELSASIVHEMRNALNTIQINIDALQDSQTEPKLRELHQLTRRQAESLQEGLANAINNAYVDQSLSARIGKPHATAVFP